MPTLHTFGCSNTWGWALPDKHQVKPKLHTPSVHAWPSQLSKILRIPVINHAREGNDNRRISIQCYTADIKPDDIVIILWSYLDRDKFIWPTEDILINKSSLQLQDHFNDKKYPTAVFHKKLIRAHGDGQFLYHIIYNNLLWQQNTYLFLKNKCETVLHISPTQEPHGATWIDRVANELMEARKIPYEPLEDYTVWFDDGAQYDPTFYLHYTRWYSVPIDHFTAWRWLFNRECNEYGPDPVDIVTKEKIKFAPDGVHPSLESHITFAEKLAEMEQIQNAL